MPNEPTKFAVILEREENGSYSVHCPALPGCSSQGEDREDALAMITEAIELVLEVIAESKREGDVDAYTIPLPDTPELLVQEVREILEDRVKYGLPAAIEFAQVAIPAPAPA